MTWGRTRGPWDLLRDERTAAALAIALLFLTPVLYAAWWTAPTAEASQSRFPPTASPFPALGPPAHTLDVVTVDARTNLSTRLTLVSLEGLVNRGGPTLYLDFANESHDPTSMLRFLEVRYGVTAVPRTADDALNLLNLVSGLVVYDPTRPESVDILTTYAGLHDAALVGPDTAAWLGARFGKPVLWDYASSDWASLGAIAAQDRAFAELYPKCNPDLLSILPPEQYMLRDYLIATRAFVFYDNQGVLASPAELAQTQRFLRATPRGIPVLGWFRSPTLTEENAFVQMASSEGKSVIDGQDVPNLSVLTDYGRSASFTQPAVPPATETPTDKVYVVVAMADGDSLDFLSNRMRALWNDSARGSFPVAWSVDPLFADLAPAWMDYYYSGATPDDRFIAGPSGAGYVYPDYLGAGDLGPYLATASRYMARADTDIPWLLNGFTSSEIQYSQASLSAYVDAVHPRGIALDYDDAPTTAAYWMQGGASAAAPVVRSTQLWTTEANFLAKVDAALGARKPAPYFLWMTVYPWRFNLTQARGVLDDLAARTGLAVEPVSPEAFFDLMVQDFQARGRADLASMQADPIAPYVLNGYLTEAQGHLDAAAEAASGGNETAAALEAYRASQVLRDALVWEDAFFLLVPFGVLLIAGILVARRRPPGRALASEGLALLGTSATVGLFLLDLEAVLQFNFWTYGYIVAGVVAAAFASPLDGFLRSRGRMSSRVAPAALFVVASGLTLATGAGFPLAALAGTATLRRWIRDAAVPPRPLVLGVLVGAVAAFAAPVGLPALAVGGVAVLATAAAVPSRTPVPPPAVRVRGAKAAGLLAVLPLASLTAFLSFSVGSRLELQGEDLRAVGLLILAATALYAGLLSSVAPRERLRGFASRALAVAFLFSAGMLFVDANVTTALMVLGACTGFALAAWAFLEDFASRGGDVGRVAYAVMALLPLLILFLRMPPVAYSLTVGLNVGGFPELLEYAFYAPAVLWAAVALVLLVALRPRRASRA